ncbi:MAG TPA: hypothetical protein DCM64_02165 [Gammaproteobacteria bacterium]|jgi:hypothetical protein|nr:hypothetical protein [Gammaproteobacteria bacterium]MDP6733482.1 hypothetical protein [Gammaproteobacteria bacterium]HAJ75238.1 hypothetical protein [Gammaproteobacteria bacterium]
MSLKVIELNDCGIAVGDESGIITQSPGFALAVGNSLEIGENAEQQARLQPTNSYNKYWHELSLEPLAHGNNIRHFADIAYAQLLHLAEIGQVDADVIFAVPGNFTRQQLAILLGLAKQSPFTAVGVVDSALAAAIAAVQSDAIIYADIQLHQVVLTKLKCVAGQLHTDSVIQVPGVGSQNFMDLMMQLSTGLFIQQCRFNPQHDANSEQQLYNELPRWLQQSDADRSSLILELKTESAVHTAKMPRESLISNLNGQYNKINQQIESLATEHDVQLLLSSRLSALPGLTAALKQHRDLLVLDPHSVNTACLDYRDLITGGDEAIRLIDKLPMQAAIDGGAASTAETPASDTNIGDQPTHVLYLNRALAVGAIEIKNNVKLNGSASSAKTIVMALDNLPEDLGCIEKRGLGVFLDCGNNEALLNDNKVSGQHELKLGDRIQFAANGEEICLIQVDNVV